MWVMSAITGLMYGTQYFQADDAPLYERGLSIMIGVVAGGLTLVALQVTIYYFHNRRIVRYKDDADRKEQRYRYTL